MPFSVPPSAAALRGGVGAVGELAGSRSLRTAALREISFSWRRRMRSSARSTAHLEVYRLKKKTVS